MPGARTARHRRSYAAAHPEVELAACCDMDGRARRRATPRGSASRAAYRRGPRDARRGDARRGRAGGARRARPRLVAAPSSIAVCPCCSRSLPDGPWPRSTASSPRPVVGAEAQARAPPGGLQPPLRSPRAGAAAPPRRARPARPPIQHLHYEMTRVDRRDPDFSVTAIHGIDAVRYLRASDYAQVRFRYQERPGARVRASPTSSWTR